MKHFNNLIETVIIVCLVPILLLPELAYFVGVRARDKVADMWGR